MTKRMTYAGAGVDYNSMDPFKTDAQQAATETNHHAHRFGCSVLPWSRGESAFVVETPLGYLAFVTEGLGTKNLVADAYQLAMQMKGSHGRSLYYNVAQCNAAMAFNDLITVGASPLIYGQYLAVGESEWFDDKGRGQSLINGTRNACDIAGAVWGGGETPTLKGIIVPGTADLAGATVGIITDKKRLINPANIRDGDAILLVESSGIHANGLTLAREIAEKLPKKYLTPFSDGGTYGEVLLKPTRIYVPLVENCLTAGVNIHYAVNITGHGWRKLMRAPGSFSYVIEKMPPDLHIFRFIQKSGRISNREMYGNFNMGAGFALYVPARDVKKVLRVARETAGFEYAVTHAGYIEKSKVKKVVIRPENLEFSAETLAVR